MGYRADEGIIGGMMYPLGIADKAIVTMNAGGKIAANAYNALIAGTGAFGAAVYTNQDSPGLSGAMATGITATRTWTKGALPGFLGAFLNQMLQDIAGPLQNYIQNNQSESNK